MRWIPERSISPREVPDYVPGRLWIDMIEKQNAEYMLRGFNYGPSNITAPGLDDHLVVIYLRGTAEMQRQLDGPRRKEHVRCGDVSLMTRYAASQWSWDAPIKVLHVYLPANYLSRICGPYFRCEGDGIMLTDRLQIHDKTIAFIGQLMVEEALSNGFGTRLYNDALGQQLCLHLTRHYATEAARLPPRQGGRLGNAQMRRLLEFIEHRSAEDVSVAMLAAEISTSEHQLTRLFLNTFGKPPHRYLVDVRLDRAKELLRRGKLPIADIAAATGFSDQSHLTRHFKKRFGLTPKMWREDWR